MLPFAKLVGEAIEKEVQCERIGLSILGLEVPHTHLHLVPISEGQLIDFSVAKEANSEDLANLAKSIRRHLD
jgi:histidine triad (HIT) family protein